MNKIQKAMVSLVKESQKNDLKHDYIMSTFKEAMRGWKKEIKENKQYNIHHILGIRNYLKKDNS